VLLGLATGLAAAGLRGLTDVVLTRGFDALLAFPGFLLVLLLVTILGGGVWQTVLALGVAGSPLFFRLVRAYTRTELRRDYVLAGTALGASRPRLLFRHALPNFLGALAVQAASTAATFLLVEASLSFLGLGVPLPTPSWGNVLQDARRT
jgi:peptide/nickel transport system permease protein